LNNFLRPHDFFHNSLSINEKKYFSIPGIGQPMSNPLCLNRRRFLIMNYSIENAVVKSDIIDGLLRSLFIPYVPFVLSDLPNPSHKTNLMRTTAFSKHFKPAAQPFTYQPSTQFRAPLNTNEHDLFTHPLYELLRSFMSLWSLRSFRGHRIFQTNLKNEHKKTRENTQCRAGSRSTSPAKK
jgi:hypothetical protein